MAKVECDICGYIHCCETYLERCENCGELISNHRDAEPVKEGLPDYDRWRRERNLRPRTVNLAGLIKSTIEGQTGKEL